MTIQWFPGHMAKTERMIKEHVALVDVVIELVDARIPQSSRNPRVDRLIGGVPKVLAMAKSDLADEAVTENWRKWFSGDTGSVVVLDLKSGQGIKQLSGQVYSAGRQVLEKLKERGRRTRPLRAMIIGIPNVGKSTLINRLAGRTRAKIGNKPGVTRGKQWVRAGRFELLDTPGVLWPKFDDVATGARLAVTGAIRDEVFDIEEVALRFLSFLLVRYPGNIADRYGVDGGGPRAALREIGRRRGCLIAGGEVDTERAAKMLLTDFRNGKLGKISLEEPGEEVNLWILPDIGSE